MTTTTVWRPTDPKAIPQRAAGKAARRLPAYGGQLMQTRIRGQIPAGPYVAVCLDSWDWAKSFSRTIVPPDLDPARADFRFVAGLDVVLIYDPRITTQERVESAIVELLACLPASMRSLTVEEPVCNWTWIKSRAVGIEHQRYK